MPAKVRVQILLFNCIGTLPEYPSPPGSASGKKGPTYKEPNIFHGIKDFTTQYSRMSVSCLAVVYTMKECQRLLDK